MVRKYFLDTYGFDPPIINRDQIPIHKNESADLKALSLKSEATFVKKNYMLPRERVTCFTQLFRDHQIKLHPEFVFKGNGTRIHPHLPSRCKLPMGAERIGSHWADVGFD